MNDKSKSISYRTKTMGACPVCGGSDIKIRLSWEKRHFIDLFWMRRQPKRLVYCKDCLYKAEKSNWKFIQAVNKVLNKKPLTGL